MVGARARGTAPSSCLSADAHWCCACAGGREATEAPGAPVASRWRQNMKAKHALPRLLARALLDHAVRACPINRMKWVAAAANELDSITGSYESLAWSLGTIWISYKARFRAMSLSDPQLPRFLLALEALTCFLPSSLLWIWTLRATADHTLPTSAALCLATAASIGPLGLAVFGQVALGNFRPGRRSWSAALTSLAGWTAVAILLLPGTPIPFKDMPWRDCVLLVVLPLLGAAHYAFLERRPQSLAARGL